MNFFQKLFRQKSKPDSLPMPSWEAVVEMMYDRNLDGYTDALVQVIYSKDKTKRLIILQSEQGFFTYQLEAIYQYDPEEWQYIGYNKNALPAMWEPLHEMTGKSIFPNKEELLVALKTEPEYRLYF